MGTYVKIKILFPKCLVVDTDMMGAWTWAMRKFAPDTQQQQLPIKRMWKGHIPLLKVQSGRWWVEMGGRLPHHPASSPKSCSWWLGSQVNGKQKKTY